MKFPYLLILILFVKFADGQDIVPNGSFEDVNICEEYQATCCPAAWFFVTQKAATGYFSLNHLPGTAGDKYINIALARPDTPARQYWETVLLCKLQAGQTYKARLRLSGPETGPDPEVIGFYFTDSLILSWNDTLLQPAHYLNFTGAGIKKLKYGWFELEKEFVADKDDRVLVIGNFSKESNWMILEKRKMTRPYSLFIDDISIIPLKGIDCPGAQDLLDSLYSIKKRHINPVAIALAAIPDTAGTPFPQKSIDTQAVNVDKPATDVDTLVINNILFDFDSYTLRNDDILDTFKDRLDPATIKKIQIAGFADDAGTETYNQELSLKRAVGIARLLSLRFGIPAKLISTEGRGISTKYAEPKRNRRAEIYIFH